MRPVFQVLCEVERVVLIRDSTIAGYDFGGATDQVGSSVKPDFADR